jgi:predicted esterase
VYLFGHSAGSGFALNMSLLETEYFAATAMHASASVREQYFAAATRKIPFAIFAGTDDPVFPLKEVRATVALLIKYGFPVRFVEIPGHGHDYRARAAEINRDAWEFFKQHALEQDPVYTPRQFKK